MSKFKVVLIIKKGPYETDYYTFSSVKALYGMIGDILGEDMEPLFPPIGEARKDLEVFKTIERTAHDIHFCAVRETPVYFFQRSFLPRTALLTGSKSTVFL